MKLTSSRSILVVGLCLGLSGAAGCGDAGAPPVPAPIAASPAPSPPGAHFPLTVTDGLGRQVTLPASPRRIVSLAPKNTELLFALGAGDRLVGVTTYCNHPPEAAERPKVGGFTSSSINLERVLGLRPDLVLCVGDLHRPTIEPLESLHVPVLALGAESLRDLLDELELLGRILERESESERLRESMQRRVDQVRRRLRDLPAEQRLKVFYQVWEDPLTAAGPTSYLGELIELAGGVNIVAATEAPYLRISEEELLVRNPDVIIAPSMGASRIDREQLLRRPAWQNLRAVQTGRVYVLDGDLVSRCGPRLIDALETVARQLYPERFESRGEPGPTEESAGEGGSP
jgi:iron complex transport system substrate-binding protein